MPRSTTLLERLALAVLLVGGAGMLTAMFLGTGDVVGTQFFGLPVPGAKEITESTMVLIVFGALAYAQIRRAHIRVELVYTHTSGRVQAMMDVVADLAAIVFFAILAWQCTIEAMISWRIGELADGLLRFPLYPARWILVIGTGLLIAQLLIDLARDCGRVRTGRPLEVATPPPIEMAGLTDDREPPT